MYAYIVLSKMNAVDNKDCLYLALLEVIKHTSSIHQSNAPSTSLSKLLKIQKNVLQLKKNFRGGYPRKIKTNFHTFEYQRSYYSLLLNKIKNLSLTKIHLF